ncbi:MAG: hypothetical protein ACP5KG_04640 [Myxococcota bacterium]
MRIIVNVLFVVVILYFCFACSDGIEPVDAGADIQATDNAAPNFAGLIGIKINFPESVTLNWLAAKDNVTKEENIIYIICMSETEGGCKTNFNEKDSVKGTLSYKITGLIEGRKYYFLVRAKDEAGNVDANMVEKGVIFEKEKDTVPPTFMGLSYATPMSDKAVRLLWESAEDNNTTKEKIIYSICMSEEKGGCLSNFKESYKSEAGATHYEIDGLTTNKTYYFVVRAIDEDGNVELNKEERSATPSAANRFVRTYGDATYRGASSFLLFEDGFLMCGGGRVGDMLGADIFISRLDRYGNVRWIKVYGGLKGDSCNSVAIGDGGYFYAAASSQSFSTLGDKDLLFLKFSKDGEILLAKRIYSDKNDLNGHLAALPDGNLVFTGYTELDNMKYNSFILLIDSNGNVLKKKYIHSDVDNYITRVKIYGDKIYLIGYTNPESQNNYDGFIIIIDKDLNIIYQKTIGGADYDNLTGITVNSNGGVVVAGQSKSFGDTEGDVYIVSLTSDLSGKNFAKVYGIENKKDTVGDIAVFNDSYILVGDMIPPIGGDDDAIFLRVDNAGNPLLSKFYRGIRDDWFSRIAVDNENVYILGGTASMHNETPEIWLLKFKEDGTTGGDCKVSFVNELTINTRDIEPIIKDGDFKITDADINIADVTLNYMEVGAYVDTQCSAE